MSINKFINPHIPISLKVLIRASFAVIFFMPVVFSKGVQVLKSKKIRLQLLRIILISIGMGATYFTYTELPITIAIPIGFTGPIFTAVLAYFMLEDRLSIGQWIAIVLGYLGVLLIINPRGDVNFAIYVAILGNVVGGLSAIYTKRLTQVDSSSTIIILANIGIVIITFLWTLLHWIASILEVDGVHITWVWPVWKDFKLLIVMGFLGTLSQLCSINALKHASPSFLSLFEYSRLVIAVPIGIFLGEGLPGVQELIGILIILAATIYNSWQGRVEAGPEK